VGNKEKREEMKRKQRKKTLFPSIKSRYAKHKQWKLILSTNPSIDVIHSHNKSSPSKNTLGKKRKKRQQEKGKREKGKREKGKGKKKCGKNRRTQSPLPLPPTTTHLCAAPRAKKLDF